MRNRSWIKRSWARWRAAGWLLPVLFVLLGAGTARADAELARSRYCMNCHGFGGTIVGPGYRQIAARRAAEGEPAVVAAAMAERIRAGSVGEWSEVAMPANAVSADEALQLAQWILSLAAGQ